MRTASHTVGGRFRRCACGALRWFAALAKGSTTAPGISRLQRLHVISQANRQATATSPLTAGCSSASCLSCATAGPPCTPRAIAGEHDAITHPLVKDIKQLVKTPAALPARNCANSLHQRKVPRGSAACVPEWHLLHSVKYKQQKHNAEHNLNRTEAGHEGACYTKLASTAVLHGEAE